MKPKKSLSAVPEPVTKEWLRLLLAHAGITQAQAAETLRVDARTMRRWCCGEVVMPWAPAELLRRLLIRRIKG